MKVTETGNKNKGTGTGSAPVLLLLASTRLPFYRVSVLDPAFRRSQTSELNRTPDRRLAF